MTTPTLNLLEKCLDEIQGIEDAEYCKKIDKQYKAALLQDLEVAIAAERSATDDILESMKIVKAVAHIGIDWGYGKFELTQEHIDTARRLYEKNESVAKRSKEQAKPVTTESIIDMLFESGIVKAAHHAGVAKSGKWRDVEIAELITERDALEDVIDRLLDVVLGSDRPEWSSAYGFEDAIQDVIDSVETKPNW